MDFCFQKKVLYLTLIIGSIVNATTVTEDSNVAISVIAGPDIKTQSKRGTDDNLQRNNNLNSGKLLLICTK